ncbi:hypothetical protein HZR84_12590 [Hyphobacterium sp. CCMP332]|nr:hypothetical protein HZR84_12590 [Hyphobacterium sp. CCMP332]
MLKDKSLHAQQITFESAITRIEVDLFTSNIWITQKDKEDSILFFKISANHGFKKEKLNFVQKGKDFILNSVHNDFLILTKIIDPGNPEDNEIIIIDTKSEKKVKIVKGYRFLGFKDYSTCEIEKSGFETTHREAIDLSEFRRNSISKSTNLLHPQLIFPSQELFDSIEKYLNNMVNLELIAPIEILEYNPYVYLCVHFEEEGSMCKRLLILNKEGELIFNSKLYDKLEKRIADSFFVSGNFLIFVSQFNVLNILNIKSDNAN